MPTWDTAAPLNAVVAYYDSGYAGGPGKVFFFADGRYVGSDTTDGSSSVTASRLSPTEIVVQYYLYKSGDPACCASGGTDNVHFTWTGTKLVALDPIPPVSERGPHLPALAPSAAGVIRAVLRPRRLPHCVARAGSA
jgi:hypothetical protein